MSHSERGYKMKIRTPLPAPVKPVRTSRILCKSSKNAYILLLGQADAGKSTTLNFLFGGREISPVQRQTGTQEIIEFSSALLHSGVLKIIDTPGLGDLNGVEWDSQIITGMDEFRKSHEELNTHIPNIILIFGRFDDNRIEGDTASFVKMLKSVDLRRDKLFDPRQNNVIIVLTHMMNGKRAQRENPSPRIELVKSLVKTFTRFPHPPIILLGENEADDFELPLSTKAQDAYVLPNGEEYPQNVIDNIFEICHASDDKIGLQIFQEAFTPENRKTLKFCRSSSIHLIDGAAKSNSSEIAVQLTNVYFNKSTEMLDKLSIEWNARGRSCTEPIYQDFLAELESKNYKDYHLIPKDLNKVLKLLLSFKREPDLISLMEKVMGLPIPTLNEMNPGGRNIGKGYSADMDFFKDHSPIEFRNYKTSSHLIYKLPEDVHFRLQRRSGEVDEAIIFHFVRDPAEYCRLRTEQLKIRRYLMVPGLPLKSGYNFYPNPKAPPRKNKPQKSNSRGRSSSAPGHFVTLVKEFRFGKLTYETSRENHTMDYNFVGAIKQLQPFTTKIRTIREQWRTFFHTYGTHVIGGGFIGGAMEVQMQSQALLAIFNSSHYSIEEPRDVQKVQMEIFAHLLDPQQQREISGFRPINIPNDLIWRINFHGGQSDFTHERFMELDAPGRANFMAEWKSSLYENPIVLEKDLELIDMKEFVSQMSRIGDSKMEKVVNSYDSAFDTLLVKLPRQSKDKNCNLL